MAGEKPYNPQSKAPAQPGGGPFCTLIDGVIRSPYGPNDALSITMSLEEWETVLHWLDYGASYNNAKRWEWRANCKDKRLAAKIVAEHEAAEAKARHLHKTIEAVLYPAPPTQETE